MKLRRKKPSHLSKLLRSQHQRKNYHKQFLLKPTSSLCMIINRNKENAKVVNKRRCYTTNGKFKSNSCQRYPNQRRRKKFAFNHNSSRKRGSFIRGLHKLPLQNYPSKSFSKPRLPVRPAGKSHAMILAEALSPKVCTPVKPGYV